MTVSSALYENAAVTFRQTYPIGTTVRGEEIIAFAQYHSNGLASDLLIEHPGKKLSAIRRHLNAGGSSRSFAETDRFVVSTVDAKREIYEVISFAEHARRQGDLAFGKSINGALSPLRQTQRVINDVKLEELDEAQRTAFETLMEETIETLVPVAKVLGEQAVTRWVHRLEARGYTELQARNLVEVLPELQREIRQIKKTRLI